MRWTLGEQKVGTLHLPETEVVGEPMGAQCFATSGQEKEQEHPRTTSISPYMQYPDTPCMPYVPTLTPPNHPNVGNIYHTVHGVSGIDRPPKYRKDRKVDPDKKCLGDRATIYLGTRTHTHTWSGALVWLCPPCS